MWVAEKFAAALNDAKGTDFVAVRPASQRDSADAYLVSAKARKRVGVQIAKTTTTDRMREESHQDRLTKDIRDDLAKLGFRDAWISIFPRFGHLPTTENFAAWRNGVVTLVQNHFDDEPKRVDLLADRTGFSTERKTSPFGPLPFSRMRIDKGVMPDSRKHLLVVDFLIAKDMLHIQTTIQETVNLKLAKHYADRDRLVLLIHAGDGMFPVEGDDLGAIELTGLDNFGEVWWVTPDRMHITEIFKLGGGHSQIEGTRGP